MVFPAQLGRVLGVVEVLGSERFGPPWEVPPPQVCAARVLFRIHLDHRHFQPKRAARLEIRGDFRNDLQKTVGAVGKDTEILEEACYAPTLNHANSA